MSLRPIAILMLPLAAACGGRSHTSGLTPTTGQYTTQVQGYLARLQNNARGQGYNRPVAGPVYGNLANGASASHEMTVVGGNQYVLFGACDNDCRDVDLKVYDVSGTLQLQDVAVDDTPVLPLRRTARASIALKSSWLSAIAVPATMVCN